MLFLLPISKHACGDSKRKSYLALRSPQALTLVIPWKSHP